MFCVNILGDEIIVYNEQEKARLIDILNQPIGRGYKRDIIITESTSIYEKDILDIIGEEYKQDIVIVKDGQLDFGVVRCTKEDIFGVRSFGSNYIGRDDVILFTRERKVNLEALNKHIIMEKPDLLLMSSSTMNVLAENNENDVDTYIETGKAYYHSYKKIPIALSNFFDFGEVRAIKE